VGLKDHTRDDDCPTRCSEQGCDVEFGSKKDRKAHMSEKHHNILHPGVSEMDEKMHRALRERLKKYTESLKKGEAASDKALWDWVTANTDEFKAGRETKINAWLELGQWYVMFATLFPSMQVPKDPCKSHHPPYTITSWSLFADTSTALTSLRSPRGGARE